MRPPSSHPMAGSLIRILTMVGRYLSLHRRSLPRALEICFWPVMDLLVWGFVTVYLDRITESALSSLIVSLLGATILWDILYRSQQAVTISLMEELWSQNLANLLVSPLRIWEWITAMILYGLLKVTVITVVLNFIAMGLYAFHLGALGFALIPFIANLLAFGWALGLFTSGLILRWGYAVEALIWGIPFFIQPMSAVFYPLSTLPAWLQPLARAFPSTYVFEGMRSVLTEGRFDSGHFVAALALNLGYFVLGGMFYAGMLAAARRAGRLARLGED